MTDLDELEKAATRRLAGDGISDTDRLELQNEICGLASQVEQIRERLKTIINQNVKESAEQARSARNDQALFLRFCFVRHFAFPDPSFGDY
jgi:hypothetical protein